MNILPKKRWHVRTKENIARVRKDEAEAAAKEKEEQKRIENADREARLGILKLKAKEKLQEQGGPFETQDTWAGYSQHEQEHVNLFSDIERSTTGTNKEHELEAKNKKEEYEKQIGYLTYLGQDTNEALGKRNWYELPPETARFQRPDDVKETFTKLLLRDVDGKPRPSTSNTKNGEVSWKTKQTLDPIKSFKHLCSKIPAVKPSTDKTLEDNVCHKQQKKHKKDKKMSRKEDKKEKLKKLREARLRRELEERRKARALLAAVSGEPTHTPATKPPPATPIKPKYNSQFNPELARQNYT